PAAVVIPNAIPATWSKATDQNGVHAYDYWRDLVPYADGVLDEGGMTLNAGGAGKSLPYITSDPNGSGIPNPWDLKMQDYKWASSLGKIVMIVDKEKYYVKTGMTSSNNQARFDLQWSLASYLLAQGNYTYLVWRGLQQTPNDAYNEPEYATAQAIGSPTDPMYQSQNVYMRDFSNGLAIENPSGKSTYMVTFPAGKYHDLYGNAVSSYTMPPHSGLVLLG
ncbi:MAG: putative glycoside hydrolase, partial [Chloroflexota bacterium]|nr:putative glycoside hydrolase [Chloroflexota bacterium]